MLTQLARTRATGKSGSPSLISFIQPRPVSVSHVSARPGQAGPVERQGLAAFSGDPPRPLVVPGGPDVGGPQQRRAFALAEPDPLVGAGRCSAGPREHQRALVDQDRLAGAGRHAACHCALSRPSGRHASSPIPRGPGRTTAAVVRSGRTGEFGGDDGPTVRWPSGPGAVLPARLRQLKMALPWCGACQAERPPAPVAAATVYRAQPARPACCLRQPCLIRAARGSRRAWPCAAAAVGWFLPK
jgi:hypothetical protein